MLKAPQASSEGGAPEYMVSYADMLTIMLAFFIVLYATTGSTGSGNKGEKAGHGASPTKENPGPQTGSGPREGAGPRGSDALPGHDGKNPDADADPDVDAARQARLNEVFKSLYYRFGPEWTISNCWVGGPPELRAAPGALVTRGAEIRNNGKSTRGSAGGDSSRARAPRPGETVLAGGRIDFDEFSDSLSEPGLRRLRTAAERIAGRAQRIEIRGHSSRRPLPAGSPFKDHWDLAYARCRAVRDYLVSQGIDPRRIRLGVAGDNEPLEDEGGLIPIAHNSRVEIHLLNELAALPGGPRESLRPAPPAQGSASLGAVSPNSGLIPGPSNSSQASKSPPSAPATPAPQPSTPAVSPALEATKP